MGRDELIGLVALLAVIAYLGYQGLQAIGIVDEEGDQFARACEEHGGTVVIDGAECEVTYGGHAYEVPMDTLDDTFDAEEARDHREVCAAAQRSGDPKDAASYTPEGQTVTVDKHVWHPESGVCELREDAVTVQGTYERPERKRKPPPTSQDCAEGYTPCVPPYPPDVNCEDVGPVIVTGDDPHALDGDADGQACGGD